MVKSSVKVVNKRDVPVYLKQDKKRKHLPSGVGEEERLLLASSDWCRLVRGKLSSLEEVVVVPAVVLVALSIVAAEAPAVPVPSRGLSLEVLSRGLKLFKLAALALLALESMPPLPAPGMPRPPAGAAEGPGPADARGEEEGEGDGEGTGEEVSKGLAVEGDEVETVVVVVVSGAVTGSLFVSTPKLTLLVVAPVAFAFSPAAGAAPKLTLFVVAPPLLPLSLV